MLQKLSVGRALFKGRRFCHLDLSSPLPCGDTHPRLPPLRHSAAHVMAMAVQRLFPGARTGVGPVIDHGFYYDFDVPENKIVEADLSRIKKEMEKIIKADLPFIREEVTYEEARSRIMSRNEIYKLELLDRIPRGDPISIYHIGNEWWDLCRGPHVKTTKDINSKALSLDSVAGAYWGGNENNTMLQRIYGTAWEDKGQLKLYRAKLAEASRRDHRALGAKHSLFSIQEQAGGGLVFWHSKGTVVKREIESYWTMEHLMNGYHILSTPHIADLSLWKTSGHLDFYKDDMFSHMLNAEKDMMQLKPMNCPFHCLVYKDALRSYKELPIRWAELGTVYRYERSGTLHGLMRARGFTQDDAHIFCLPSQLEDEIVKVLDLAKKILSTFGFSKVAVMLSTRPEESIGSDSMWKLATDALVNSLDKRGMPYEVDEGGGAFYGPKIDIKIEDALGRKWQCSTIQCDFNLPERFDLEYVDSDQSRKRPIMLHRAIFGSLERFIGILIENTAANFPLWLAPEHLRLLPVTDEALEFCNEVKSLGTSFGLRIDIDTSGHRIAKQIRNAEMDKVPVMSIVGKKEVETGKLSLRMQGRDLNNAIEAKLVFAKLRDAIIQKQNTLDVTGVDYSHSQES